MHGGRWCHSNFPNFLSDLQACSPFDRRLLWLVFGGLSWTLWTIRNKLVIEKLILPRPTMEGPQQASGARRPRRLHCQPLLPASALDAPASSRPGLSPWCCCRCCAVLLCCCAAMLRCSAVVLCCPAGCWDRMSPCVCVGLCLSWCPPADLVFFVRVGPYCVSRVVDLVLSVLTMLLGGYL